MIHIATIFTGIGSIEHALERLNLPTTIEFACDNGDVDILSTTVAPNFTAIQSFQDILYNTTANLYGSQLQHITQQLQEIYFVLDSTPVDLEQLKQIYHSYSQLVDLNANQRKSYREILSQLEHEVEPYEVQLHGMRLAVKLEADLRKSKLGTSQVQKLLSQLDADWETYKYVLKQVNFLAESLSMLYERVNTERMRQQVFALPSAAQQKAFVDKLYTRYEANNKVKQAYLANYNLVPEKFHWNVSFLDGRSFQGKLDLLVGGSPCQSFSAIGKQRGLDDTRGTLFYEFARLIQETQPKVFIYENVRAILSNDKGATWKTITRVFDQLGYDWHYQILNAKDYGVPQSRNRLFVVGFRKDLQVQGFKFPEPVVLEKRLSDYLETDVAGKYYLQEKGVDFVTSPKNLDKSYTQVSGEIAICQKKNQQFNWRGDFVFVPDQPHNQPKQDLELYLNASLVHQKSTRGKKTTYSRVCSNVEENCHDQEEASKVTRGRIRKLTPRECLRLMGFADSFKIVVSDTATYQQTGNAIVVDVLMNLIQEILKVYPELGSEDILKS